MSEIDPHISIIAGFVSAVLAGIAIKMIIGEILRPVLMIDGNEAIIIRTTGLRTPIAQGGAVISFNANRIRVRNTGKSAAKDCKVYVHYTEDDVERAAWMVSSANSGYTVTLNVDDREFVDLCAISDDLTQPRVIPLEHGYSGRVDSCTRLPPGDLDITVRVTSNARPTERRVRLHTAVDHFPGLAGLLSLSNKWSQRNKYDIVKDTLEIVYDAKPLYHNRMIQTRIGYEANLTHPQTVKYLTLLVKLELLILTDFKPCSYYEITSKGRRCLQLFGEIEDDLKPVITS